MADVLAERRREQEQLLDLARGYVRGLSGRLALRGAAVVGSVARGDFNVWSDVDVVIVANELPEHPVERAGLLLDDAPPRVQPVGFTPEELAIARARRNRLVLELAECGVVLFGEDVLGA